MSGGSVPSASTASEGEPEVLQDEVKGPGQQEAIPAQEDDPEEDYEVRAGRQEACRPEEGLSGVEAAHPICLPEPAI